MSYALYPLFLLAIAVIYFVGFLTPLVVDCALVEHGSPFTFMYVVIPAFIAVTAGFGIRRQPMMCQVSAGMALALAGPTGALLAAFRSGQSLIADVVGVDAPAGPGFYLLLVATGASVVVAVLSAPSPRGATVPAFQNSRSVVGLAIAFGLIALSQAWPFSSPSLWDVGDAWMLIAGLIWFIGSPALAIVATLPRTEQGFAFATGLGAGNSLVFVAAVSAASDVGPVWTRDVVFGFASIGATVVAAWAWGPLQHLARRSIERPMSAQPSRGVGAWAPDPFRRYSERFHDGHQWTSRVRTGTVEAFDPPPPVAVNAPPPPSGGYPPPFR